MIAVLAWQDALGAAAVLNTKGDRPVSNNPLKEYKDKRDFRKTSEPTSGEMRAGGEPIFVIQKHDARTLHYDLRLEVDGVLKSWAVPKGPSTDPRVKRLAVPTEDHPLDYAQFEGAIPEGEYGGGTVLVWDIGTYRNLREENPEHESVSMAQAYADGHIAIWLEGRKLEGGYALVRTGRGEDKRWLLIKMKDEKADARRNPVTTQPASVLTGRTLQEIAAQAD